MSSKAAEAVRNLQKLNRLQKTAEVDWKRLGLDVGGGAVGGTVGYATSPEDADAKSKVIRTLAGILAGSAASEAGQYGISKLRGNSDTDGPTSSDGPTSNTTLKLVWSALPREEQKRLLESFEGKIGGMEDKLSVYDDPSFAGIYRAIMDAGRKAGMGPGINEMQGG